MDEAWREWPNDFASHDAVEEISLVKLPQYSFPPNAVMIYLLPGMPGQGMRRREFCDNVTTVKLICLYQKK